MEYAHDAAISGNGVYVAFDGSIAGVTGVWRCDLLTGALEQVAGGDAEMPSISANGQYLSFTTNEGASLSAITDEEPDEAPKQEAVNVYVRNMALAPGEAGAFTVVSAANGSAEPLTYHSASTTMGASAAGRSAISADGGEVAFVTTAVSNLVAYPKLEEEERARGETPQPHTPAGQVAVRYIESGRTVLVSRCYFECGEAAAAGASEPVVGKGQFGAVYLGEQLEFPVIPETGQWPGASISADGSTVAWMGEDIGQQAAVLPSETLAGLHRAAVAADRARLGNCHGAGDRRIGPGQSRCAWNRVRVRCRPSPPPSDPCQGPFVDEQGGGRPTRGCGGEPWRRRLHPAAQRRRLHRRVPLRGEAARREPRFRAGRHGATGRPLRADMHPGLTRDRRSPR